MLGSIIVMGVALFTAGVKARAGAPSSEPNANEIPQRNSAAKKPDARKDFIAIMGCLSNEGKPPSKLPAFDEFELKEG